MHEVRNVSPNPARRTRIRPERLLLAAVLAVSLFWIPGCASTALHTALIPSGITVQVGHFESSGATIRVDEYRPAGNGKLPAAIVVHGSSGVHELIPNTATEYAVGLAKRGLVAFVVHYFDATGTIIASRKSEAENYFVWIRVLKDAVTWVRRRPEIDPHGIGLLGHSLGGFLAVGAAANDPRISRIVLFGGGLEPFLAGKIKRMPPALICHGAADDEVPLSEAESLVEFMREGGYQVQLNVYPGERHIFSNAAAARAVQDAAEFLAPELTKPVK